jgi:hypothetical protein
LARQLGRLGFAVVAVTLGDESGNTVRVERRLWHQKMIRNLALVLSIGLAAFGCGEKRLRLRLPQSPGNALGRPGLQGMDWDARRLVNAQIRAQVTGYLLTQNYSEGSQVKKGDLLYQIDSRPFEAALSQAQAKLGAAVFVLSRCRRFSARLADAEEVIAIRFRRKTPSLSLESRNFRILVWILYGVFASLTLIIGGTYLHFRGV